MSEAVAQESAETPQAAPKASAARNTLNIFGTRLVMMPTTILISILVARILGPTDRGVYGFLVLLGAFALPLLMLGFGASVTYAVSSRRFTAAEIFYTSVAIGLLQGSFGALLLGGLWNFGLLGETAREISAALMIPVLISLPLQSAILLLTRLALGDSWFALTNRLMLITALMTAAMLFTLVVVCRLGVQGAVLGMVVNNAVILLGIMYVCIRRYHPPLLFNTAFIRDGWRYGLKSWFADVVGFSNIRLDQWVLGMAAAPGVLGAYVPAVAMTEMLWMLPDSMAYVLFNKIAGARDPEEQAKLVERLNRIVFWSMALFGIALVITGPWLIPLLYGAKYVSSAAPLTYLVPGTVAFSIHKVLTKYFGGTGHPHYSGTTVAVGASVGFVLYLILIPRYGTVGAAIAHTIGYTVTAAMAVIIYRRLVAPHKPNLFGFSRADAAWLEQQVRSIRGRRAASGSSS